MTRTLDRYISREFIPPFLGGLGIFSFILMMDKVLRLADLVFMKGVRFPTLVNLLILLIPPLFSFTIPMAILFASLMTFGRLASDNEIIAMRSCGQHPVRIILPILIFGLISVLICFWLEASLIPSANRSFRSLVMSFEQQKEFLTLTEKGFQDLSNELVAYVHTNTQNREREKEYEGILIADYSLQGISRVIFAKQGHMMLDKTNGQFVISLMDGSIHHLEREGINIYQMMHFGRYETNLHLPSYSTISKKKKFKEFSLREIRNALQSDPMDFQEEVGLQFEWHRKFAFPFACLIFALIGSLIGMESRWSGKCSSFAVSLMLIIIYYFVLTTGSRLSMAGYLTPGVSAWFPNVFYLGIGITLMRKVV